MPDSQQTALPPVYRRWSGHHRKPFNHTFKLWKRSVAYRRLLAFLPLCVANLLAAQAQTAPATPVPDALAVVTFYTHHAYFYSGLPGTKAVFTGRIADGDTELFSFRPGYAIQNNAHLTLQFPAGPHEFKAYQGTDASKKIGVRLELKPGQHYYLRATANDHGVVVVDWRTGQIEVVDCATAHEELAKNKILPFKNVTPSVSAMILPDQTIEPCSPDPKSVAGTKDDANGK